MKKIKLTEQQIAMLQMLKEAPTKKIIKINESQYKRLFKKGLNENVKKNVDLNEFAREVIVFVKDMISSPETAKLSNFWNKLGFTKETLTKMLETEGLITMSLDESEGLTYLSEKNGFRKKMKNCHKKINELSGDYPAGAEFDPRAPFNEPESESESEVMTGIKAKKIYLKLVYYSEPMDGLCIFKKGGNLYAITIHDLATLKPENLEPYLDSNQHIDNADGDTVENYINDKLIKKQIKAFSVNAPKGELALITPEYKEKLLGWYGEDKTLVSILNGISETSLGGGAGGDSGQVGAIGKMTTPIKKNTGYSPEESIGGLINNDIDETTSTISAGGDSGTFAYDTPGFTKNDGVDMFAGNKQNKEMSIVKCGVYESKIKAGQVYKNGVARRKVIDIKKGSNPLLGDKVITVRQWGDKEARDIDIPYREWGYWELIHENKKTLKITESQLKKIVESENFKANVAAGSTYSIEVKAIDTKRVTLKQDNGQVIVVHHDDIPDLIKALKNVY